MFSVITKKTVFDCTGADVGDFRTGYQLAVSLSS